MAKPKKNRQQRYREALNEVDEIKEKKARDLMELRYSIKAKFKNKKQKDLSTVIKNNRIIFVSGAAGTGKTFIALKTALEMLKSTEPIGDIQLSIPIIPVGRDVGHLPGDLHDKTSNYFEHFYDNLIKLTDKETVSFLRSSELIHEKIINFIRGNTFGKYDELGNPIGTFCILDEAQNLTKTELKTYISRLGENSKMVIMGDPEQCDLKIRDNQKNALQDAIERFSELEGVEIIEFDEEDIVRDPFLIEIMKRYKD